MRQPNHAARDQEREEVPFRRKDSMPIAPITLEWLKKNHPEDATCAFCGEPNDNWDKEGFFFLWTRSDMIFEDGEAACKACMDGEPGERHFALHGPGKGKR